MKKQFTVTEENLINLIKANPEAVSTNNSLIMYYWLKVDGISSLNDIPYTEATPAESITRSFRRLVKDGIIKISHQNRIMRMEAEDDYYERFSQKE